MGREFIGDCPASGEDTPIRDTNEFATSSASTVVFFASVHIQKFSTIHMLLLMLHS
jgi:hypothetical protein